MYKKYVWLGGFLALAMFLAGRPAPAEAFWLGVPESLKTLWQNVKAQEAGGQIAPAPSPAPSPALAPAPPPGTGTTVPPMPGSQPAPMPPPPQDSPSVVGDRPVAPPPQRPYVGPAPGEFPPAPGLPDAGGLVPEVRREGYKMERDINQFERTMKEGEERGMPPRPEMRERVERVRGNIDQMKRVGTPEDVQNIDMDQMNGDMGDLERERKDKQMQEQQLKMLQRGLRGMEQGVSMFDRQLASLAKRGLPVPTDIKEKLEKAKAIIAAIKAAKTFEEAEAAGMQDMQEIMQDLNDSRAQLEMLARWPQMLKEADRQLAQLTRELKRAKTIVDRLLKKEIDLTSTYSTFAEAITKLKAVRDEAVAKVQAGEAEDAMESLQSDFFGQMEDAWQSHKVIMMMSNLGRFMTDFKRGLADAQRMIRQAERKKADTTELKGLYEQAKAKGEAVVAMLKDKEIDEEEIMSAMSELEDIKQEFEETFQEVMGVNETQAWEKGPQQFKEIQMAPDVARLLMRDGGER